MLSYLPTSISKLILLSWNFEIGILILSTWYLGQLGQDFAANPLLKIPIGT